MHCSTSARKCAETATAVPTWRTHRRMAGVTKYLKRDFVTRSNYFVTDACRIGRFGCPRSCLSLSRDATASSSSSRRRAVSIRTSDSIDYTNRLSTLKREDRRYVPALRSGQSPVPLSRGVSSRLWTPVLHPFCKLTVIQLPRCPAVPIDRHSPIRHRDVRESRLPALRKQASKQEL